ncbi:hypothetical protein ACQP1W_26730 [Spirillospora sp. CA-255316]
MGVEEGGTDRFRKAAEREGDAAGQGRIVLELEPDGSDAELVADPAGWISRWCEGRRRGVLRGEGRRTTGSARVSTPSH